MSKRARTRPVKIRTLQSRKDYLSTILSEMEPGDRRGPWMRAEVGALEWAIPILQGHVQGLCRRVLEIEQSTVEDINEDQDGVGITESQKIR
jgi:hypothetical protein